MKYLVIAALLALLLLLLYSRIYPYLQFVQKLLGVAKTIGSDPPAGSAGRDRNSTQKADRKLVRCVGCGTWIPAARAIGTGAGNSIYCSRECIERSTHDKEKKMVG
ncbi:MAG TPA: hypothetical protein VGW76_18820 [Pyrinomonadaceae bacterium]|nr:hypothetical protein [Pyrinomonadaceae bacterium]